MMLWLITRKDKQNFWEFDPWPTVYDTAQGFVVRAEGEDEARKIASENAGDEGRATWFDNRYTECAPLTSDGKEGLIIMDFVSG